jgi:hypothetical protein
MTELQERSFRWNFLVMRLRGALSLPDAFLGFAAANVGQDDVLVGLAVGLQKQLTESITQVLDFVLEHPCSGERKVRKNA